MPQPPISATIDLNYTARNRNAVRHAYRLPVYVTKTGDEILSDWSVEVRFPRRLLEPGDNLRSRRFTARRRARRPSAGGRMSSSAALIDAKAECRG